MAITDIPRPRFARMYLKMSVRADQRGGAEHRRRLLEGLSGRVVEVGAGNGRNFAHCPPGVTEHVIARRQPLRALLRLADRSGLWPAIGGGCHPARDTGAAIEAAGFEVERCERFGFRACVLEPRVPHILGVARSPAAH